MTKASPFIALLFLSLLLFTRCGSEQEATNNQQADAETLDSLTLDSLRKIGKEIDSAYIAKIDTVYKVPDTLNRFFEKYGATGTFAILDPQKNIFHYHDAERAEEEVIPAGSFYLPLALIALESGALPDTATILKWNGEDYGQDSWNRDQNLRLALQDRTPWFFQQLAKKVGKKRMQFYLNELDYGNRKADDSFDFWNNGSLLISPKQQIQFLRGLYRETLPFASSSMKLTKEAFKTTASEAYSFNTFQALSNSQKSPQALFMGYLIFSGDVPKGFYFATIVDATEESDASATSEAVTLDLLRHMKLL